MLNGHCPNKSHVTDDRHHLAQAAALLHHGSAVQCVLKLEKDKSSVSVELVCPVSTRMTRSTTPVPYQVNEWMLRQLDNVGRCVL